MSLVREVTLSVRVWTEDFSDAMSETVESGKEIVERAERRSAFPHTTLRSLASLLFSTSVDDVSDRRQPVVPRSRVTCLRSDQIRDSGSLAVVEVKEGANMDTESSSFSAMTGRRVAPSLTWCTTSSSSSSSPVPSGKGLGVVQRHLGEMKQIVFVFSFCIKLLLPGLLESERRRPITYALPSPRESYQLGHLT